MERGNSLCQSLTLIDSLDGNAKETLEIAGSGVTDFTTVKRPTLKELKERYEHARDKQFYMTAKEEYPIHIILGDSTYCKIQMEQTFKGRPENVGLLASVLFCFVLPSILVTAPQMYRTYVAHLILTVSHFTVRSFNKYLKK